MEKWKTLFMILVFSVGILFLLLMNFSLNANKVNVVSLYQIFMEIKSISVFFVKVMLGMLVFLYFNYNSYIYYGIGITMNYGYVFIYAFALVFLLWSIWFINGVYYMISHFLPLGVDGLLKIFIPVIELLGVFIRPMTLAIRLATNISCGHVVLLMFSFFVFNVSTYLVVLITILLYGLYFIEFLVCAIQAYVFWSLIYIYMMEMEV